MNLTANLRLRKPKLSGHIDDVGIFRLLSGVGLDRSLDGLVFQFAHGFDTATRRLDHASEAGDQLQFKAVRIR